MADFSSKDIEKLVVLWEGVEDLWNISSCSYHKKDARSRTYYYRFYYFDRERNMAGENTWK